MATSFVSPFIFPVLVDLSDTETQITGAAPLTNIGGRLDNDDSDTDDDDNTETASSSTAAASSRDRAESSASATSAEGALVCLCSMSVCRSGLLLVAYPLYVE